MREPSLEIAVVLKSALNAIPINLAGGGDQTTTQLRDLADAIDWVDDCLTELQPPPNRQQRRAQERAANRNGNGSKRKPAVPVTTVQADVESSAGGEPALPS